MSELTAVSVAASTAPVIRIRAPAANSISIAPRVPEGAVNGCRSDAMETPGKTAFVFLPPASAQARKRGRLCAPAVAKP